MHKQLIFAASCFILFMAEFDWATYLAPNEQIRSFDVIHFCDHHQADGVIDPIGYYKAVDKKMLNIPTVGVPHTVIRFDEWI